MAYVTIKEEEIPPEFPYSADTSPSSTSSSVSRRTPDPRSTARRLAAASRLPRLQRGQVRVIIRPRDGIDVKKMSLYAVMRALTTAVGITEEACSKTGCVLTRCKYLRTYDAGCKKRGGIRQGKPNNPRHQATCNCCLRSCARKLVQRGRPQYRRAPHGHST
ncbi:hypothetical protein HPB48_019546 [Haemaphysalis longicornis]|uniref:Uncharacterized protein n=1 Tax=Haemaphysalis longicornis TaxID=44386 RepID=A0A9J6GK32_HAELO|nr:hypothetical protein HPB48_019546 [Haemaphysalis longicornis]